MVQFSFTSQQKELYDSIVSFASKEITHDVILFDKEQTFPKDSWKKCRKVKLPGLCIAEEFGGAGHDAVSTAAVLEALGYASNDGGLNFSIAAHLLACVKPFELFGSEEQKQRFLPDLCNGALIAANAMTEPQSGSDAFAMKTSAQKTEGGYILNGTKTFVTNGPVADIFVAYAVTNSEKGFHGGISAFILDRNTKGISFSPPINKMGLRTSPMCQVNFENVLVSAASLLGKEGAGGVIFSESMNWERALMGALHVGTMKKLIERSVNFAKNNFSDGEPLYKQQGIAFLLADMALKMEASRLLVYRAAGQLDLKQKDVALAASMAKVFCSTSLQEIAQLALQVNGTQGYLYENHLERYVRDAAAAAIYSGSDNIQKNIIAAWLQL